MMNPYDRICADVHSAIQPKSVKAIIEDLTNWNDDSHPQCVEGSMAVDEPDWSRCQCSISLQETQPWNNFSPAMVTTITAHSTDGRLDISLSAVTGSDAFTREIGRIVEFMITSDDAIPETLLASLGSTATLGQIVPLPDDLADYADFVVAIKEHSNLPTGSMIIGVLPVKDLTP